MTKNREYWKELTDIWHYGGQMDKGLLYKGDTPKMTALIRCYMDIADLRKRQDYCKRELVRSIKTMGTPPHRFYVNNAESNRAKIQEIETDIQHYEHMIAAIELYL